MRISLEQAATLLKAGNVVAVPTETVYGLAACLDNPLAIEKIFALKGRPRANPLIIHVADRKEIDRYAIDHPPFFEELAEAFWPGPLTLVVPVNSSVPEIARAELPTAGFRIPSHNLTRSLLKMTGPLVMPSANLSGKPSATTPEHVEEDFGLEFPILDGGHCQKGVESSILIFDESEWVMGRLGAIAPEKFQTVLGYLPRIANQKNENKPLCPGQLFRHYSPKARLVSHEPLTTSPFVLGFKERTYPNGKRIILLGSLTNPEEVAENLYKALRQLDLENAAEAWVDMDFPRVGLWQTIAERLARASRSS